MAVATTNAFVTSPGWTLAAAGSGEYQAEITIDGEYALAASTPAAGIVGHRLGQREKVTLTLPGGINLYVRAPSLMQGGAYVVVVSSGQ